MSYSLFDNKFNFTEILHFKIDAERITERDLSKNPSSSGKLSTDSGKSSDNNDPSSNVFLLEVLDSLLEVCDDGHPIRLSTHLPPPSFVSTAPHHILPPPVMTFRIPSSSVAQNHAVPPQSVHYQHRPTSIPVPLVPTPQLMSIPPPSIRYFH